MTRAHHKGKRHTHLFFTNEKESVCRTCGELRDINDFPYSGCDNRRRNVCEVCEPEYNPYVPNYETHWTF